MKKLKLLALGATVAMGLNAVASAPALAQAEPILGQLTLFGTDWCPRGWAKANGALLPISQNAALFSLLGTTYGGNGQTNFALPDLQGRAPVSYSANMPIGLATGSSTVTLTVNQMPAHNHLIVASSQGPSTGNPSGGSLATFPPAQPIYSSSGTTPSVPMNAQILSHTGGSQPINVQSPILAMNWCIATVGIFPSRP